MSERAYSLERFLSCVPNESLESSYAAVMSEKQRAVTAVKSAQVRLQVLDKQQELAQQLQTRIAEVKHRRALLRSELTALTDSKLAELQRKVEMWQQVSGVWIRVTDKQELRIYFSRLNSEANRDCYLTLDACSGDIWEIKDCQPTLSGLQKLLDILNETKDLGKFCRSVREGFKASV